MKENIREIDDKTLLYNIKSDNCNESTLELIKRHENLVYNYIHKFHRRNPYISLDDMLSDKYLIFADAINTYKTDKNTKFTTWLYYRTKFHCLNSNRNKEKHIFMENSDIDINNEKNDKYYVHNTTNQENKSYIFNILEQLKDKRISKIFQMRYFDGKKNRPESWNKIADKVNLSVTRTISLHNIGCNILLKKIRSNDIIDTV